MCHRRSGLHLKHLRIEGAQTHGAAEALDCIVVLAERNSLETAEIPGSRQVGIEHQRPLDRCDAPVEIAAEMGERVPASCEGDSIVCSKLHRAVGQSSALGKLTQTVAHPV